jgi:uncharacterized protein YjbJ (UPF0337 family)
MGSQDKTRNKAQEIKGKAKETLGHDTRNPELRREGRAERAKANLKQAGEKVKDAFKR